MSSPHGFLIEPTNGKRYANTKNIGGYDMIVSVSEEDHRYSNRFGIVKELPSHYQGEIKVGDTLCVHHNVFKLYYDMQGKRKSGKSYLKENTFLVEEGQYFMFNNGEKWQAIDKYCFVKPVKALESFIKKPNNEEPLMGEMKYPNSWLVNKGVNMGDLVLFTPDSEYEFMVDDEKLFRVHDHQIVAKL